MYYLLIQVYCFCVCSSLQRAWSACAEEDVHSLLRDPPYPPSGRVCAASPHGLLISIPLYTILSNRGLSRHCRALYGSDSCVCRMRFVRPSRVPCAGAGVHAFSARVALGRACSLHISDQSHNIVSPVAPGLRAR